MPIWLRFCEHVCIRVSSPRSPTRKLVEQSQGGASAASRHGQGLSKSPSPNGEPKRIRKGRGFTERYAFARRYRTPSPDRSSHSYHRGDRNIRRNFDRYARCILLDWTDRKDFGYCFWFVMSLKANKLQKLLWAFTAETLWKSSKAQESSKVIFLSWLDMLFS